MKRVLFTFLRENDSAYGQQQFIDVSTDCAQFKSLSRKNSSNWRLNSKVNKRGGKTAFRNRLIIIASTKSCNSQFLRQPISD